MTIRPSFSTSKARSTVDVIATVMDLAREASAAGKCCAVVTLDVRNAFNLANCGWIKDTLAKLDVPGYLARIIERFLWNETDDGPKEYVVITDVPQGSVLGPLLWNIMYDAALGHCVPREATLTGFAVDLAVEVIAKHHQDVELNASETVNSIKAWLQMVKLLLAADKTEAVRIINQNNTVKIRVGNYEVVSKSIIKYLG